MRTNLHHAVVSIIFTNLLVFSGCAGPAGPSPSLEYSGFLGDYSDLKPNPNRRGGEIYIRPGVDFSRYDKVIIDPVVLDLTPEAKTRNIPPEILKDMASQFHQSLVSALKGRYTIVDRPGPRVMRIRTALTDLNLEPVGVTSAGGGAGSRYRMEIAQPGEKADVEIAAGSTSMEMEILDADTGQRLAAGVDRKGGAVGPGGATPTDAKAVFDYWAKAVREHLDRLQAR